VKVLANKISTSCQFIAVMFSSYSPLFQHLYYPFCTACPQFYYKSFKITTWCEPLWLQKFCVCFIDNFNFVYKLTCWDNYLHFCVNWWAGIQVFVLLIHLQPLHNSFDHPAAQFLISSHTVDSFTTQYAHLYTNIQTGYNAVGIATRYWLGRPAIESRRGRNFHGRPDRPWGPPSRL
jgi:hypothetical protein